MIPIRNKWSLCLLMWAFAFTPVSVARAQANACSLTNGIRETELIGPGSDYARLAELTDGGYISPRLARRLSNPLIHACPTGPWAGTVPYIQPTNSVLTPLPFSSFTVFNSAYPGDRNNNALWSGRGLSTAIEGGFLLQLGPLSLAAAPILTYQQNRSFELLPSKQPSPFSNGFYRGLDAPQRFGASGYSEFNLGQSYLRVRARAVSLALSNENIWWGPGLSNAVLFTNTAPGFPHLAFNLVQPVDILLGHVTGEAIWGKLSESKYYDGNGSNDHRFISGVILAFEPRGIPGLFLGFGRTFVVPWDSVSRHNAFAPLFQPLYKSRLSTPENPRGNSNDDQRLSLMARYVVPRGGIELYGEWAREDHAVDFSDFAQEPEHASAHIVGLQKLFAATQERWIRINLELANLQQLRQDRPKVRTITSFYTHSPAGHTNLGQLLGASIGPGAEAQLLQVDALGAGGSFGLFVERVRRNEFSATGIQAWSTTWPPRHDVELTIGARVTRSVGPARVDFGAARSKRYNRDFMRDENNTSAQLRIVWVPTAAN